MDAPGPSESGATIPREFEVSQRYIASDSSLWRFASAKSSLGPGPGQAAQGDLGDRHRISCLRRRTRHLLHIAPVLTAPPRVPTWCPLERRPKNPAISVKTGARATSESSRPRRRGASSGLAARRTAFARGLGDRGRIPWPVRGPAIESIGGLTRFGAGARAGVALRLSPPRSAARLCNFRASSTVDRRRGVNSHRRAKSTRLLRRS